MFVIHVGIECNLMCTLDFGHFIDPFYIPFIVVDIYAVSAIRWVYKFNVFNWLNQNIFTFFYHFHKNYWWKAVSVPFAYIGNTMISYDFATQGTRTPTVLVLSIELFLPDCSSHSIRRFNNLLIGVDIIYIMDCGCQRCHKMCSTRRCADDDYCCWKSPTPIMFATMVSWMYWNTNHQAVENEFGTPKCNPKWLPSCSKGCNH